jgi:F-type H+-transporting ATPase subunit a
MMFVIELVGPVTKCFALAVRLFANMFAGHVVIAALLGLGAIFHSNLVSVVGMFAAVAMDLLEVFVAFLQAYIFTLLAIVFVGAAVHPEH